MSQPDYPLFSKRIQKSQRSRRGGYNFEKSKEYELAERWFEERREAKQERPPSPMVQSPPPTIKPVPQAARGPPPGLPKPIVTKCCKKCKVPQQIPVILNCCESTFCLDCVVSESTLYNRCYSCKAVIDIKKYEEYDGLDLKIPSFEEFDYKEPEEPAILTYIPLNKPADETISGEAIQMFDTTYSTPQLGDLPNYPSDLEINQPVLESQEFLNLVAANYQVFLQYLMISSMISELTVQQ